MGYKTVCIKEGGFEKYSNWSKQMEMVRKYGLDEEELKEVLMSSRLMSSTFDKKIVAHMKYLENKCKVLTESLDNISSGMLTAGEAQDEAELVLLRTANKDVE